MNIKKILEDVKKEAITVEEAERLLKISPYEELEFAKLDFHRAIRQGVPEVVFCQGKKQEYLEEIVGRLYEEYGEVLGTRATAEQARSLQKKFPNLIYEEEGRIIKIEKEGDKGQKRVGHVVICTGGTADIPVAKEAYYTADYLGANVTEIYDVGISGLHRLLSQVSVLQEAYCIIAVAGMEGALASVVAGLVSCPVIAVPTSVGYGANFGGMSALLTMVNSCANGVSVVNIDNGYGAGYLAAMINRQSVEG